MGGILELIKLIYGSKALSKVLGTRTNVIRLPDNELKQYTKNDLNIEAASDKLAQKAKADMKELLADFPRMNDAEKLIFKGNLTRLGNKLGVTQKKQGSAADVLEFGTGEKISPEGIMSLTEKAGQKNPPTTLMGNLESRIKQLEASGEDLSKMKGQTYDEFMNDITQGQRTMIRLEDEGLVRATAREIIDKDIKSKKIKLPKEVEADFKQGGGEPIDVFRQFYGEDALEQLNSMVPDFKQMYSSKEAAEAAIKKFKFKFKADRPPGSISIEDAKKAEQEFNIVSADSEEGKIITEKLIGKPKAPVTELVTAEKIILDMKNMDPMDAMKEANKVLKREGKYKNLKEEDVERIMEDTNDFIFGRDIPEDPEGFAKGGRVGMAGGGILKLAMKFFNDNNPVSAYKKYLKYVKETAQKDPAKLAPEMGGIVVGSELIHRGLRRKLKEAKEKNDTDDSEDTTTEDRTEKAGGGVSQGLDYLMGIERRGYQEGGESMVSPDDAMLSYDQAVEKSRQEQINKNALAQQKFNDYLKEKTGYGNIEDYYQDPERLAYDPRAAEGDITKAIYDAINLEGYKPYGYEDTPFQFEFDKDPNFFYTQEYDDEGRLIKRTPLSSEEKQKQIKNYLENALYDQSVYNPYGGFDRFNDDRPTTIEGSKFFLDQLKNLQKRDPDFEKVIKEGKYIDALENRLRYLYDPGEYQKLQETLDPGYSKYASDKQKINKAFGVDDVLYNKEWNDQGAQVAIDSSIYSYLSEGERNIIERSQSLPTYLTGYAQQLIQDARNRKQADQDRREQMLSQADQYASKQMVSPDDAMNQYDISNQTDEVIGVGSGALTAGSLFPKYIDDFQYAAPPGTDIDQVRNLARQTASDKSITALIKDVYNDPDKFKSDFKPKAKQIKTGYPQYLKEGILSATGFQPTSQIGGGTNAARAFLEKIKSVPGAQFLGKVLPGVGIASGVYDVGSRLSQGDYFGAGLGALSAIPFVGIPAAAMQATYDNRNNFGPLIEKATNFFNKLQSAPSNIAENINTAVDSLNPYQQQRYVNYAVENPDRAIQAAQRDQDFRTAIGRRDQKQKGGLSYLLGM
jgi:hypothetical protein